MDARHERQPTPTLLFSQRALLAALLPLAACATASQSLDEGRAIAATPQRPTFSSSTSTTVPETLELEAGILRDSGARFDTPVTVKYGVNAKNEAFVGFSPFVLAERSSDYGTGFGDVQVGWRQRFVEQEENKPSAAWQAGIKLPTGSESEGVGSGEFDVFGAGLATWVASDWSLTGFVQLGLLGEQAGGGVDHQLAYAIAADRALKEGVGMFGELTGVYTPDRNDEQVFTTLGLTWAASPGMVFDSGIVIGLSNDAPDFQWLIGFTRNLGPARGWSRPNVSR